MDNISLAGWLNKRIVLLSSISSQGLEPWNKKQERHEGEEEEEEEGSSIGGIQKKKRRREKESEPMSVVCGATLNGPLHEEVSDLVGNVERKRDTVGDRFLDGSVSWRREAGLHVLERERVSTELLHKVELASSLELLSDLGTRGHGCMVV